MLLFPLVLVASAQTAASLPEEPLASSVWPLPESAPRTGDRGEAPDAGDMTPERAIEAAKFLVFQKKNAEARELLLRMNEDSSSFSEHQLNEIEFLIGLVDLADKDYDSAIFHFRRVLSNEPNSVRVRLELGRAFYLNDDYANAQRQFLFARAGKVPRNVQRNIDRYLVAIRSLRTMQYTFSLSLATDSNLNAGPAIDTITMYGVPFRLSDSAQANSGVGLAFDGGAEYAPRLARRLKWRFGTQLHRAQYRRSRFDDMTLSFYTGPHVTLKTWDLSLLGTAARRWYGNRTYTDVLGSRFAMTYFVTSRLGVGGELAFNHLDYPRYTPQGGYGGNASLTMFYTPSPSSILRGRGTWGRQNAKDKAFANHIEQFNLSFTKELGAGFTLTASPTYSRIAYDEPLAAFGRRRIDHQWMGQLAILNRKIDFYGITPRILYTYTRNVSAIALYTFNRSRLEFGITRYF